MKKRVVSAVLCMAMLATMFTGCGSSADTDSTADKKTDTAATNDAAAEHERPVRSEGGLPARGQQPERGRQCIDRGAYGYNAAGSR